MYRAVVTKKDKTINIFHDVIGIEMEDESLVLQIKSSFHGSMVISFDAKEVDSIDLEREKRRVGH